MSEATPIERIVVPTDGLEEHHLASRVAGDLGARLGLPVELLSAASESELVERFGLLRREAASLTVPAGVDIIESDDVSAVVTRLLHDPGTLVCLASAGQMALTDAAKRSVSAYVLTEIEQPVLVVGPACRPVISGRRLAIAVDGTADGERIVEPAITLADALGLAPTLYQVLVPDERRDINDTVGMVDVVESGYLSTLARSHSTSTRDIEYDVLHDRHPGAALERLATDPDVAVIALNSHGMTPSQRLFTPSVAHRVIRHATCPVLVGSRHEVEVTEPFVPSTGPSVALGLEGLETDASALAAAVDEANSRGAVLQLIHVWQPTWSFTDDGALHAERETARTRASAMLNETVAELASREPDLKVSTWLTDGMVSTALLTAARHADVLVVGERQFSAIEEFVFGHAVDAVLSQTTTPVIIVPPTAPHP